MNTDLQKHMYVDDSIRLHMPLQYQDLLTDLLQYNSTLQIGRFGTGKSLELDMKIPGPLCSPKLDFDAGYNYNRTKSPASVTSSTVRTVRIGVFP